ncbi:tyrosine-type recombinase/integrase [Catenuloplanes japonicus]|uniref:tyrosine-type recombinase/integrase n=1 Tax=Catenuloplanes japonicus TaxID=33876 RepID=UPI0012F90FD2|nr:site-specific integrase [Catenuloplanes japonicus]
MASVDTRRTGWALQWRLGGSRTGARQTLTFSTIGADDPDSVYELMTVAKRLVESRGHDMTRDQLEAAVLGDPTQPVGTPTFSAWATAWIEKRRMAGDAQSDTLDDYERILKKWAVPYLGAKLLHEITHDTVEEWSAWMRTRRHRGEPLSVNSRKTTRTILHTCLGAAVPKWIPANPAAQPSGARRRNGPDDDGEPFEPIFLTSDEVKLILRHCPPPIRDLVFTAVHTGLRLGELLVLRRKDVELAGDDPHIQVSRALKRDRTVGRPKSRRSRRLVTISPGLCRVLAARLKNLKPDDLVFPAARGGMMWEAGLRSRYWLPAVAAAQRCAEHPPPLPEKAATGPRRRWRLDEVSTCACTTRLHRVPRFHDLRHTHASMCIEEGWSAKRIQERLGHATYAMTMDRYGHLRHGGDSERLGKFDEALGSLG